MKYTENQYDEFVEKLKESCPSLFKGPHSGFSIGAGWWPLVETLCHTIHSHVKHKQDYRADSINYNQMIEDCKHGDYRLFNERYKNLSKSLLETRMEEIIHEDYRKVPEEITDVIIEQVKEKFGGLRFYISGGDEFVYGAIWLAESLSTQICETCGNPGKRRNGGWVRTLCDFHEEEYQKKIEERARKDGLEL